MDLPAGNGISRAGRLLTQGLESSILRSLGEKTSRLPYSLLGKRLKGAPQNAFGRAVVINQLAPWPYEEQALRQTRQDFTVPDKTIDGQGQLAKGLLQSAQFVGRRLWRMRGVGLYKRLGTVQKPADAPRGQHTKAESHQRCQHTCHHSAQEEDPAQRGGILGNLPYDIGTCQIHQEESAARGARRGQQGE